MTDARETNVGPETVVSFAKYLIVLAVIGTFKIRHIFYQTDNGDIHHLSHLDSF